MKSDSTPLCRAMMIVGVEANISKAFPDYLENNVFHRDSLFSKIFIAGPVD